MAKDQSLPAPGWYEDPYQPGSWRWFDGAVWTTNSLAGDSPHGDRLVGHGSQTDVSLPRDGERPYDGGGGWQGLYANRVGRSIMRSGARWGPVRVVRWVATLTVVLALCAWGDTAHREILVPLAAVGLVATVVVGVRESRERAHWNEVGHQE